MEMVAMYGTRLVLNSKLRNLSNDVINHNYPILETVLQKHLRSWDWIKTKSRKIWPTKHKCFKCLSHNSNSRPVVRIRNQENQSKTIRTKHAPWLHWLWSLVYLRSRSIWSNELRLWRNYKFEMEYHWQLDRMVIFRFKLVTIKSN